MNLLDLQPYDIFNLHTFKFTSLVINVRTNDGFFSSGERDFKFMNPKNFLCV